MEKSPAVDVRREACVEPTITWILRPYSFEVNQ